MLMSLTSVSALRIDGTLVDIVVKLAFAASLSTKANTRLCSKSSAHN